MNKFDTVCNQVLSEQMLFMEASTTLGDQTLALELQKFNNAVAQCTDEACVSKHIPFAQRLVSSMMQKVKDSRVLQVLQQYQGAPVAALKALYQMLFTRAQ